MTPSLSNFFFSLRNALSKGSPRRIFISETVLFTRLKYLPLQVCYLADKGCSCGKRAGNLVKGGQDVKPKVGKSCIKLALRNGK